MADRKKKYKMLKICPDLHADLTRVKKSMGVNEKGRPFTFEDLFSLLTQAEVYYRVASRNYFGTDKAKARGYAIERAARLRIKKVEWPEKFVFLGHDDGKE